MLPSQPVPSTLARGSLSGASREHPERCAHRAPRSPRKPSMAHDASERNTLHRAPTTDATGTTVLRAPLHLQPPPQRALADPGRPDGRVRASTRAACAPSIGALITETASRARSCHRPPSACREPSPRSGASSTSRKSCLTKSRASVVEPSDGASSSAIDEGLRKSSANSAKHERGRVRAAGHMKRSCRATVLKLATRPPPASLPRCSVEL